MRVRNWKYLRHEPYITQIITYFLLYIVIFIGMCYFQDNSLRQKEGSTIIDSIDIRILQALKNNARVNASEIGEQINMSVSAVIERIRKLEHGGIIGRYTVLLDHKRLGMDVAAFMSVGLEHPKFNDGFIEAVRRDDRIIECSYLTGDFDFLLKIIACSTDDLTSVLTMVKSIPGVSLTRTQTVLATNKNEVTAMPGPGRHEEKGKK